MLGCGSGSGGTQTFSRELVRWRFSLLLAGTILTLLFGQAGSALAAGFFNTGSMSAARQDHTATLLDDGTVLVTGGASALFATVGSAELYNPSTGTFTPTTGTMAEPRLFHTATKLADGRVLIAGGASAFAGSSAGLATATIYNPATGTFTPTGAMGTGRKLHTATLLESGKVLITGGRSAASGTTLGTAELFDPAANAGAGAFTATTGPMLIPRESHTASRLTADGKVLIAGGLTTGGATTNTAELYDPVANTFAPTGTMLVARNFHAAVVLNDGSVLITGGDSGISGSPSLSTAELYDPALGTFGAGTVQMRAGHSRHTATLLSNGNVLVAGDLSAGGIIPGSTAEIFLSGDGGNVFLPFDPMNTARSNFRAVTLNNGTVLLTGGFTGSGPTAAAELFNASAVTVTPAGNTFPDTEIGFASAAQTFTISTNADLAIAPFSITGTDSTMFTFSTTCSTQPLPVPDPPPPPSLTAGGSCTVSVTFTPTTLGIKSAILNIATDDPFIPNWTVPLSGTGIPVQPVLLTVSTPTGGTVTGPGINCPGDCSEPFLKGTQVLLTATALPGFQFTGWSGACSGSTTDCTTVPLLANAGVSAAFADIAAPTLTLSTLPGGASTANAILNIAGNVTDNVGIQSFAINGTPVLFDAGGNFSYALKLVAGAKIITSVAADAAGNTTTDTRTITLDPTVPALTVTAPADNSATAAPLIPVSGTADATATLTLTVNGGTSLPLTFTGTDFSSASDVPLTAGVNTLIITAAIPGGKTATAKRTVILDTQLPSLAVTDPNQDAATGQQQGFTIGGTATGLTAVTVIITVPTTPPAVFTLPGISGAFTQPVDFTVSKTYPITITAADTNGNTATTVRNVIFSNPIDGNMDLSADGNVTIADALMALRTAVSLFTPNAEQKSHGDVAPLLNGVPNPDGVVTIADALLILKKVVGLLTW